MELTPSQSHFGFLKRHNLIFGCFKFPKSPVGHLKQYLIDVLIRLSVALMWGCPVHWPNCYCYRVESVPRLFIINCILGWQMQMQMHRHWQCKTLNVVSTMRNKFCKINAQNQLKDNLCHVASSYVLAADHYNMHNIMLVLAHKMRGPG